MSSQSSDSPEAQSEQDARHAQNALNVLIGRQIRNVRKRQRLTLSDVEYASDGEFRISVLGAYERGERALRVERMIRLARIYGVPPVELLPPGYGGPQRPAPEPQFPAESVL